MFSEHF